MDNLPSSNAVSWQRVNLNYVQIFSTTSQSCPPNNLQFADLLPRLSVIGSEERQSSPTWDLPRLLTAVALRLTLTGPAASFADCWCRPPPKGFRFQLEQAHGGKGTDCESKKQCWIQWRWGVVATEKSIFQEGLLSSWVGFGWREITVWVNVRFRAAASCGMSSAVWNVQTTFDPSTNKAPNWSNQRTRFYTASVDLL